MPQVVNQVNKPINSQLKLIIVEPCDFDFVYETYTDPKTLRFMSFEKLSKEEFQPLFSNYQDEASFFKVMTETSTIGVVRLLYGTMRKAHNVQICGFSIHPHFRGQGYGKQTIHTIISMLKSQQKKRVELIVESDNPEAISLYKKCGFQKEGVLRKYYKRAHEDHYIDDYIMSYIID